MNKFIKPLHNISKSKIASLLLLIGLLIYGNSIINGFISDDKPQILENPLIHNVSNIPKLFFQGNFYDQSGQRNNYYRPIQSIAFSIVYALSGKSPFGFHLIQLLMHITNAFLIYLIFERFINKGASLLLSVLFLTHPINVEAVAYISALGENLFVFFGLIALILTARKSKKDRHINLLIFASLLLSILSKETGVIFFLLTPMFAYLFHRQKLFSFIAMNIGATLVYLFLRLGIAQIPFKGQVIIAPIQNMPLAERTLNIPKIIFFYFNTFLFPKDLIMFQTWTVHTLNLKEFYMPLFVMVIFIAVLTSMGLIIFKKKQKQFKTYLFFFVWLLSGVIMHIQIFPLDQTVSDRWFYFPIIGLIGLIGVAIKYLDSIRKFNSRIVLPITFVIIFSFSLRTIARNANWKDENTLFMHDIQFNQDSYQLEKSLGDVADSAGDFEKAEKHYIRAANLFPSQNTYSSLGYLYLKKDEPEKAVEAYSKALSYDTNFAISWIYLAISRYKFGDREGAISAAENAYSISPTRDFALIINTIRNGLPINIR